MMVGATAGLNNTISIREQGNANPAFFILAITPSLSKYSKYLTTKLDKRKSILVV